MTPSAKTNANTSTRRSTCQQILSQGIDRRRNNHSCLTTGPVNASPLRRTDFPKRTRKRRLRTIAERPFSSSWFLNKIYIFQTPIALVFHTVTMGNAQPDPSSQNSTYGLHFSTVTLGTAQPDPSPLQPDPRVLLGKLETEVDTNIIKHWQRK